MVNARAEWHDFVWGHLGDDVAVTFERAGREVILEGRIVCHADGTYQVGPHVLDPETAGWPVRWTVREYSNR